jgi:hypothetical protein
MPVTVDYYMTLTSPWTLTLTSPWTYLGSARAPVRLPPLLSAGLR